ncbi:MAG: thioredoxin-dependent thiol peroxidase [Solirubrobacterales bacterium]
MPIPETGKKAPAFTLKNQDGETVKLADLKGDRVVLYFYPKADTPGCTTQACSIRDSIKDYKKAGVRVIGVSADEPEKLAAFKKKYKLPFELLSDPDHKMIERYGQWVEKSMYGKKYMGIQRSTFIIGPTGKVEAYLPKVQPKKHDSEVFKALKEIG